MLLKLAGAALIIASASAAGVYFSLKEKFRAEDMRELAKAICIFKSRISYSHMPLAEIFEDVSERASYPVSQIFSKAGILLSKSTGKGIAEIWNEACRGIILTAYYSVDDMEEIFSFGRSLGLADKEQQLQNADILLSYIEDTEKKIHEKYVKDSRVYRSMGFLGGVLITVILF